MTEAQDTSSFDLEVRNAVTVSEHVLLAMSSLPVSHHSRPSLSSSRPSRPSLFVPQAYISNYTGFAKTKRLLFIASKTRGSPLEIEALKRAITEIKQGENIVQYREAIRMLDGRAGPSYALDTAWIDQVERSLRMRMDRSEADLAAAKNNMIKESIRLCYNDLGNYAFAKGDLAEAFRHYLRARDYCTQPRHVTFMCLNVIRVALELGNYYHVSSYVQKAESGADVQDLLTTGKLRAAAGLTALESRNYKQAARLFCDVPSELGQQYAEVLAPQDIALYGLLCALASFDRTELRTRVVSNPTFREYVDASPEIRDLLTDFYGSKYATGLTALQRLMPQLQLDVYMAAHAETLMKQIRERALVMYTAPFRSVDMRGMEAAFK